MRSTCVGDPDGSHRNAGQLDGLAVEEFETGVAQILISQLLENFAGVWSCYTQHANAVCYIADVDVISTICSFCLYPPEYKSTEKMISRQTGDSNIRL